MKIGILYKCGSLFNVGSFKHRLSKLIHIKKNCTVSTKKIETQKKNRGSHTDKGDKENAKLMCTWNPRFRE